MINLRQDPDPLTKKTIKSIRIIWKKYTRRKPEIGSKVFLTRNPVSAPAAPDLLARPAGGIHGLNGLHGFNSLKEPLIYCAYQCSGLKMRKKRFFNCGLGWPRRSDLRSSGPPKSRSLNNFEVMSWPRKMLPSMFFDTPNSPCEVTASEAAEAGLIVTMTWPTLSTTHMQSFNLLALKLWICIGDIRMYRQLLRFEVYIVRWLSAHFWVIFQYFFFEKLKRFHGYRPITWLFRYCRGR